MHDNRIKAHIRKGDNGEEIQKLLEHLEQAAIYASDALQRKYFQACVQLIALIHDMGKATVDYQRYLKKAADGEKVVRGSVNHTFAAVRWILERYKDTKRWGRYASFTADLLAYASGAHHGLFDCVDPNHRSGFQNRLEKEGISYEEAVKNFFSECMTEETLDELFAEAVKEVETAIGCIAPQAKIEEEFFFLLGLLGRLLLSAVVEGDRRDTAEFMNDLSFPKFRSQDTLTILWTELSERADSKLDALEQENPIQKARRIISWQCREMAKNGGGVYRLNVPTGAGKTLSSLRFALHHAKEWGKSRIIFTSPLLSILDQNAKEIRKYVERNDLILEHHSNVVRPQKSGKEDELDEMELLMETWDVPIILTTLVQFLNTLFDGSMSSIRRFHALCDSVIVIDEVQTVPEKLLSMFNLAVDFLTSICGTTVVLCSATQPCLEELEHPIYVPIRDMVPYDPALWETFQRTKLVDSGKYELEDIPVFAMDILAEADSLLIICNTKTEAQKIYLAIPEDQCLKFHLSAAMCATHRIETIDRLNATLKDTERTEKVVCVSTQVIEAGVDISFARVIRLTAGMDNIVQAAGRCNRHGESKEPVPVYVITCQREELKHLPEIRRAKEAACALLQTFQKHPERFDHDLFSDAAIRQYYRSLYAKEDEEKVSRQNGLVQVDGVITSLFSLLSTNKDFVDAAFGTECEQYTLRQAFRTAGKNFSVFEENTVDVLVPYGEGKDLVLELGALLLPYDLGEIKQVLERVKRYTVSLYECQRKILDQEGALMPLAGGSILTLLDGHYDAETGLSIEQGTTETLIY